MNIQYVIKVLLINKNVHGNLQPLELDHTIVPINLVSNVIDIYY